MDEPLSNRIGNVLQGFIPGLATMDTPAVVNNPNSNPRSNSEGAVIIDMPGGTDPNGGSGGNDGNNDEGAVPIGGNGGGGGSSEMRAVKPLLERLLPFLLILLVKILYDHRLGKYLKGPYMIIIYLSIEMSESHYYHFKLHPTRDIIQCKISFQNITHNFKL